MSDYPDGNPKTAIGATKVPLHLVPPSATHYLALAFKDGAAKYGPYNWREAGVSASVYVSAAKRHIDAWWDGEELSHDAKVEHLAHAMACMAILLDAKSVGMLNDDRPPKGAASALQQAFGAPVAPGAREVGVETWDAFDIAFGFHEDDYLSKAYLRERARPKQTPSPYSSYHIPYSELARMNPRSWMADALFIDVHEPDGVKRIYTRDKNPPAEHDPS